MVLGFFSLIILERILNRTNTQKVSDKNKLQQSAKQQRQEDNLKRAKTQRSMTSKIKTMKTTDLDMGEGSAAS